MMNLETNELIDSIKKLTQVIEKNNSSITDVPPKQLHNKTFIYIIKRYIQEVFEASLGLIVVILMLKKKFDLYDFSRIVLLIGFVTLILEEYNVEYLNNFKQGIHFTLGSIAFNN